MVSETLDTRVDGVGTSTACKVVDRFAGLELSPVGSCCWVGIGVAVCLDREVVAPVPGGRE